jgi:hypothetical protein
MKVKNYSFSCFPLGKNPQKLDGTYYVAINLDNKIHELYNKVKNPEEGLKIIMDIIKGVEFGVEPDLRVKNTNILGEHIFTRHYELHATN